MPSYVQKTIFLQLSTSLGSFSLSALAYAMILSFEVREDGIDVPFRSKCSIASLFLSLDQFQIYVLISSAGNRSYSDKG